MRGPNVALGWGTDKYPFSTSTRQAESSRRATPSPTITARSPCPSWRSRPCHHGPTSRSGSPHGRPPSDAVARLPGVAPVPPGREGRCGLRQVSATRTFSAVAPLLALPSSRANLLLCFGAWGRDLHLWNVNEVFSIGGPIVTATLRGARLRRALMATAERRAVQRERTDAPYRLVGRHVVSELLGERSAATASERFAGRMTTSSCMKGRQGAVADAQRNPPLVPVDIQVRRVSPRRGG